jgi:3-deoxy-D-manno-octulosonic-acid transferase
VTRWIRVRSNALEQRTCVRANAFLRKQKCSLEITFSKSQWPSTITPVKSYSSKVILH